MLKQTKIGIFVDKLQILDEINIWLASAGDESVLEVVAELQREQLRRGERPDGTEYDYYSPVSQNVYGKPNSPIKWEDSGYFYKHIQALVKPDEIEILNEGTIDEVTGQRIDLELRFDEIIIGLQNDSIKELIQEIKKKYIENVKQVLFKH